MIPNDLSKNRFTVLLADQRLDVERLKLHLDQQHYRFFSGAPDKILSLVQTQVFDLLLLPPDNNSLEIIRLIKKTDSANRKTPVIALLDVYDAPERQRLIEAGFDDCLSGNDLHKQVLELVKQWRIKNSMAEAWQYIQVILNKTKNNHRLTVTIFNKLFDELPRQLEIIKEALTKQHYDLAGETIHKLHGSVSFCELEDMRKPAYDLEHCLRNENYADAHQHFLILQQCISHFTNRRQMIADGLATFGE